MIEAISAVGGMSASQNLQMTTAAGETGKAGAAGVSFGEALKSTALEQVASVQKSEQMSMAAMHGNASVQDVVQATVQAEMAVETALAVRNKLIEGYQEIMRMPV